VTDDAPIPPEFATLRERAVKAAQAASGEIWTDYNLHDPGVTLLEQTCFALTEVGYRNAHAIRDLLTGPDGVLHHDALGLFDPGRMLPTEPVTDADLAALLSESDRIAHATVARSPRKGLYEIEIIPEPAPAEKDVEETDAEALDAATEIFYRHRPLCTDVERITVFARRPVALAGEIAILPTVTPARVAAEVFFHAGAVLRSQANFDPAGQAATRADVYDRPEAYLHALAAQDGGAPDLEDHLATFRKIPGIVQIVDLSLVDLPSKRTQTVQTDGRPRGYRDLVLPAADAEVRLTLTLDGVPLKLGADRIREEVIRVATDHMAAARHHLDGRDWDVRRNGRRRAFAHVPVDSMLPQVYRSRYDDPACATVSTTRRTAPPPSLAAYRGAADGHLAEMTGSLADLPRFFAAGADRGTEDPARLRERLAVLDYLIALQGEEMPPTRNTGLHHYRSRAEQARFDLDWRIAYLDALPAANAARGTGPSSLSAGGFLRRLSTLADLPLGIAGSCAGAMCGLDLAPEADPPCPGVDRGLAGAGDEGRGLIPGMRDLLVPRDPTLAPLAGEALLDHAAWIADGRTTPGLFSRSVDPDAYLVAPDPAGAGYRVLFDAGDPRGLYRCGQAEDRRRAHALANKIRNGWRAVHERAEGAYLVEDVLLRGQSQSFAPHRATLVLTGWTARTTRSDYRAYVEALIARLAPAHLLIVPLWLSLADMRRFEAALCAGGPAIRLVLALPGMRARLSAVEARLAALAPAAPSAGAER